MEIQPGVKIQCDGRTGTLGLLVNRRDDSETTYLLSCWHILDAGEGRSTVTLPDYGDAVVAHYQRSEATAIEDLDVAIAALSIDHGRLVSNRIRGNSRVITKSAYWRKKMTLKKYGAATGMTRALLIDDADNLGHLRYGLLLGKHPSGQVRYSDHGDSGSIWYAIGTGKAIALHSKGGLAGNLAVASPLVVILEELNLKIMTTQP